MDWKQVLRMNPILPGRHVHQQLEESGADPQGLADAEDRSLGRSVPTRAALSGHQPGSPNVATVREVGRHRHHVAAPNATAGEATLQPNPRLAKLPLDPKQLPAIDHRALDQAAPATLQLDQACEMPPPLEYDPPGEP